MCVNLCCVRLYVSACSDSMSMVLNSTSVYFSASFCVHLSHVLHDSSHQEATKVIICVECAVLMWFKKMNKRKNIIFIISPAI